jgi:hypothetical protein
MGIKCGIAVVAHDAGAANHIFAWISSGLIDHACIKLCLGGPAAKAYDKIQLGFKNYALDDVLDNTKLLISGTGWASTLEQKSRMLAAERSIKSIAVIDHWSNYKERFISEEIECLPSEIWVTDEYALTMANKIFPNVGVIQQPNDFICEQVRIINKLSRNDAFSNIAKVLFVMEPIRQKWLGSDEPGELQSLNFLVNNLSYITNATNIELVIKPHPSDPQGKYDSRVASFENFSVSVNESASLAELIAWSDVVVGCQTYAMVVALSANKKVVSALPDNAPPCLLPHEEILHLRELV